MKAVITQDDLKCLCELSLIGIARIGDKKLFKDEIELVEKLKWFALQATPEKPNFAITDTDNKPNIDEI